MSDIDVSGWKKFRVGDLFDIQQTKGKTRLDLPDGDDLPYVAATAVNNGVADTCGRDGIEDWISNGHGIVFVQIGNGAAGMTTYQADEFVGMAGKTSVGYLKDHQLTQNQALFLVSIFNTQNSDGRFGFDQSWSGKRLLDTQISLPVTSTGEPDWDYMDSYMFRVLERETPYADHFAAIAASGDSRTPVDTSGWGEFRVGELFDIHPTKAYAMVNAELMDDGDTPVIVNSSINNGVGGFTTQVPTEKGGIITFSDTTSADSIFYQPVDFCGYPHVQGMYVKHDRWSEKSLLFFVSLFRARAIGMGFDYGNKFRRDIAAQMTIKLPVTSTGEPDWDYMDSYMSRVLDRQRTVADHVAEMVMAA